jgi:hypothetical protein
VARRREFDDIGSPDWLPWLPLWAGEGTPMAITLQVYPAPQPPITIYEAHPELGAASRGVDGCQAAPGPGPFPGADILYVHDRASYQAVITRMRETLGELGRDGAEHQAL